MLWLHGNLRVARPTQRPCCWFWHWASFLALERSGLLWPLTKKLIWPFLETGAASGNPFSCDRLGAQTEGLILSITWLEELMGFSLLCMRHRSPKRPKTVLSGGRLREMTWWSQTNFFRDHLYHCYGFYLDRLDTPSSFSLISENQLIFCFSAIFDTKFSRYHRFEGTSSLSSVFVQLNSVSSVKKLWKNWVSYLSGGLMLPATNVKKKVFWLHGFCHGYIHGISHAYHTHF